MENGEGIFEISKFSKGEIGRKKRINIAKILKLKNPTDLLWIKCIFLKFFKKKIVNTYQVDVLEPNHLLNPKVSGLFDLGIFRLG